MTIPSAGATMGGSEALAPRPGVARAAPIFKRQQHRLILCLDGTWNDRDDSTNVLHHYNQVIEGPVTPKGGDPIVQKKKYHRGVGTGPLDKLTGGGFGFGLEANVRAAYGWLVENFHEGDDDTKPDEIYVF